MAPSYLLFCMCCTNSVTLIEFLWVSAYVIMYNSFVTKFIMIKSYYFLNSQNRSNFTCSWLDKTSFLGPGHLCRSIYRK